MSRPIYSSPEEAEAAFYEAFMRADLEAMMEVWADDDSIVCIHPMGPRLQGRRAIAESWRHIFDGGAPMRFEIADGERTQDDLLAIHCVHENISHGRRFLQKSQVIATNVYRLTEHGWRMIVHHGSPSQVEDEPDVPATPPKTENPPKTLH